MSLLRFFFAGILALSIASCGEQSVPEEAEQLNMSESLFSELENRKQSGDLKEAAEIAQNLINNHSTTNEAKKASELLPEIEEGLLKAQKEEEIRKIAEKWAYSSNEDPMSGKIARYASISSENLVNFGFPYEGYQNATLTIRNHPQYGHDVYLSLERGQILCQSYSDCSIRVRFDDNSPERWSAVGAADHDSTLVFLRSTKRFFEKMKKSKMVLIQIPVYQEGNPTFEFQVSGFDNAAYIGKK